MKIRVPFFLFYPFQKQASFFIFEKRITIIKFFILTMILLFSSSTLFAQNKYFIYFKDKGENQTKYFYKSNVEKDLFNQFSAKAIERRKKNSNEEIFRYSDYPIYSDYKKTLESLGVEIVHELPWFNAVSVYVDENLVVELKQLPFITKIEKVKSLIYRDEFTFRNSKPNFFFTDKLSNKTMLNYGNSFTQLNLSSIPSVHASGIKGKNILIGLLDTGFRWREHEALQNITVIAEKDFVFGDDTTANQSGDHPSQDNHGTAILSIVGGKKDGQIYGAAFESNFILGKTEDIRTEKRIEEDNYAAAIHWMEKYGVDVISSSLGYSEFDDIAESYTYKDMNGMTTIVARAVDSAFVRGVIMVTAAGNEFNTPWKYIISPADAKYVIASGAVNTLGAIASFSSRGPTSDGRIKPDVCAMGVAVYAAFPGSPSLYSTASGTSAATPIVAGVAGLLLSHYPELNNNQVRDAMRLTASQSSKPDTVFGWGIVDAIEVISYPQIVKRAGDYYLLKSIFNSDINTSTVKLHFSTDGGKNYSQCPLSFAGSEVKYETKLPILSEDDKIRFYFTYKTKTGIEKRIPEKSSDSYSFVLKDKKVFPPSEPLNLVFDYKLFQNYPNPFNNTTRIKYDLPVSQSVSLNVYDILGRKVRTLLNNVVVSAGNQFIDWNGKNDFGAVVPSGVYFYRLETGQFTSTKKLVLLK